MKKTQKKKLHCFKIDADLDITSKETIINNATEAYANYMDILLPGWQLDPNSKDTPRRVVKAFIDDIASGLYKKFPKITAFENVEGYEGIVLQSSIPVKSFCSHHHQNIFGHAHVAYIPSRDGKVIGLSKLNRIVDHISRMPCVQENLTVLIHNKVNEICEQNLGVAVIIRAKHNCVSHRGVKHDSDMSTAVLSGAFKQNKDGVRDELYKLIQLSEK